MDAPSDVHGKKKAGECITCYAVMDAKLSKRLSTLAACINQLGGHHRTGTPERRQIRSALADDPTRCAHIAPASGEHPSLRRFPQCVKAKRYNFRHFVVGRHDFVDRVDPGYNWYDPIIADGYIDRRQDSQHGRAIRIKRDLFLRLAQRGPHRKCLASFIPPAGKGEFTRVWSSVIGTPNQQRRRVVSVEESDKNSGVPQRRGVGGFVIATPSVRSEALMRHAAGQVAASQACVELFEHGRNHGDARLHPLGEYRRKLGGDTGKGLRVF
jgi:hypothetical protein